MAQTKKWKKKIMNYMAKVSTFLKCIEATGSVNPRLAISMAHSKYKLNATNMDDQQAWCVAVSLAGNPFKS